MTRRYVCEELGCREIATGECRGVEGEESAHFCDQHLAPHRRWCREAHAAEANATDNSNAAPAGAA